MFPWQSVLLLVALLCAVGQCQDDKQTEDDKQREEYLKKCKDGRSNLKSMDVYYYQPMFCFYYCLGEDEDGNVIFELRSKKDGQECKDPLGILKYNQQCLNGTCVPSSDVQMCEKRASDIGKLQHLDSNECYVTCKGENGNLTIKKDKGDKCLMQDNPYKNAECNSNGRCVEKMTFIQDEPKVANDTMAEAACKDRHPGAEFVYTFKSEFENPCQYLCYAIDNNGTEIDFDYLTFENGYSCGDGRECLGAQCTKSEDVKECQARLAEEPQEMETKGCTKTCYGKDKETEESHDMTAGSTCVKENGYYQQKGVCKEENGSMKCEKQKKDKKKKDKKRKN